VEAKMKKIKRAYATPKATRVKLVVKNAILGTCHTSPVLTPQRVLSCEFELSCWTP
jgi:hypothetical protein